MPPNAPPSEFVPRPQPADFRGVETLISIRTRTSKLDWTNGFLRFIALSSAFFLLSLLWSMLVPESSIGILRFLQEDTGLTRNVIGGAVALFFMRDIGQSLRGIKPRHGMVFILSGQFVMALFALVYTLKGEVSTAGLAGHFGVFWISLLSLWTIAQYTKRQEMLKAGQVFKPHIEAKTFLIPGLAIIMFLSAFGVITRPDGAISNFLQTRVGIVYYVIAMCWLVVGSGFITLNHIKPKWLFVAVMGYYFFVGLLVGLFTFDPNTVSLTFVVSHVVIAIEAFFIILLQTKYSPEG